MEFLEVIFFSIGVSTLIVAAVAILVYVVFFCVNLKELVESQVEINKRKLKEKGSTE